MHNFLRQLKVKYLEGGAQQIRHYHFDDHPRR